MAYNQFSANTTLLTYNTSQPAGDAGGNGRKGAQKIIIFETDGAPNTTASASFSNQGPVPVVLQRPVQQRQPSGQPISQRYQRL